MEFEYKAYQKIRRELQKEQAKVYSGEAVDTAELMERTQQLLAMIDALRFRDQQIGVFNHPYWMNRIGEYIAKGRMNRFDACYFNLKRFSLINDLYGRKTGTEIMRDYVRTLDDSLTEDEFVCRIGGDNFAVVFLKKHLQFVMDYLQGAAVPISGSEQNTVHIEATAGYYVIPEMDPISEPSVVMDRISDAFHAAKQSGVSHVFWNAELMQRQENRKHIEAVFLDSLKQEEFLVFYQPKIDLKDYRLIGAEALCRWLHKGKLIPPNDFIPVLEQSYDICELDFYMLEHVCQDMRRWMDEGREIVTVSVNLSRRHMKDLNLLQRIIMIVDKYDVPHQNIEIELTETTTDVDFTDLRWIVNGLQGEGFSTSVDDFGVGYSSLNLIRELPWNVLKIDKSFLPATMGMDEKKDVMFRQLISLAKDLGLECIVEGVETAEQVRILKRNHCFLAQGFFFDRPLPVEDFEKRLDALKISIA